MITLVQVGLYVVILIMWCVVRGYCLVGGNSWKPINLSF